MKRKVDTCDENVNPQCFFKLMISPCSFSKLRIPEKFVREFKDGLSADCTLTVPTGETKRVAVVEDDDKLWFKDGWQEFVEHFSVGYGYFLLFSYQGSSTFRVHIFDLTACEITYQSKACSVSPTAAECSLCDRSAGSSGNVVVSNKQVFNADDEADDSDSGSDASLVSQPTRPNNSHEVVIVLDSEDEEIKSPEGSEYAGNTEKKYEGTQLSKVGIESSGYPSWLRNHEKVIGIVAAAGVPIPENPFFVSLIKRFDLCKGNWLHIPAGFAREFLSFKTGNMITVETSDGKQWRIQCCWLYKRYFLYNGWIMFAREIGLEVGDVCIFELTDADNYVLKFQVVKKAQIKDANLTDLSTSARPHCSDVEVAPMPDCEENEEPKRQEKRIRTRNKNEEGHDTLLENSKWLRKYDGVLKAVAVAGVCIPQNPFFVALINSYDLHFMHIPLDFTREHVKCKKGDPVTIETDDGRQWVVQYYINQAQHYLSKGWIIFARDIGLELGDVCFLELSDAENYVLKVQVAKKSKLPAFSTSSLNGIRVSEHSTCLSKDDEVLKVVAVAVAGVCLPKSPFYVVLIKHYNLHRAYYMMIPIAFAREHLKCEMGDLITIETYDKRRWLVKCYRDRKHCRLIRGWMIFARDVGLEEGDACVFELSDSENRALKVQVVKKASLLNYCTSLVNIVDEIKPRQGSKCSRSKGKGKATPVWKDDGVHKAVAAAGVCLTKSPFFTALIKHHTLRQGCCMHIPLKFVREYIQWKKGDRIMVETYDGRRWAVQYYRNSSTWCLSRGWMDLARGIGLEVGDVCVFELSDAEKRVLKVQVAKKAQIKDTKCMV